MKLKLMINTLNFDNTYSRYIYEFLRVLFLLLKSHSLTFINDSLSLCADFTVDHRQNYTNEDFAGVQQVSNGQALLEAIGWPGNFANITRVYVLNIFSKQAIANVVSSPRQDAIYRSYFRANIEPISPTWSNVKDYMNWAFTDIGLRVSERVVTVLNDFDFQDLTGCPTQCAYTLADFPGSGVASVPITIEPRENGTEACPSTLDLLETKNINASLTAPTAVDEASSLCKGNTFGGVRRTWIDKYVSKIIEILRIC